MIYYNLINLFKVPAVPRELLTVGYEGTGIDAFIADLLTNDVQCVLDVRAVPRSRKPGFSKTPLQCRLNREGICYFHFPDLGTPKPIRDNLTQTHDYSAFFKKMQSHLAGKARALELAYGYVVNMKCCLLCFERLAAQCHRKLVAEKIKLRDGNGLQIKHI